MKTFGALALPFACQGWLKREGEIHLLVFGMSFQDVCNAKSTIFMEVDVDFSIAQSIV